MDESLNTNTPNRLGTVVRLRSGGPLMTVKETAATAVRCGWFNEEGVYQEFVFDERQLMTANNVQNLVRLVSGGPSMSRAGMEGNDTLCVWFDKNGNACERKFPTDALTYD